MRRLNGILIIAVTIFAATVSLAQEKRFHGQTLDENRRLLIEEQDGVLRIGVFERTRSSGDRLHEQAQAGPGHQQQEQHRPEDDTSPTLRLMQRHVSHGRSRPAAHCCGIAALSACP